jgi:threonine synthase
VSWEKARIAIEETRGVVADVTDAELLLAKRAIDESGIGCEPASACSLAGVRKLRAAGTIRPSDDVVCVLTGHVLKDPDVVLSAPGIDRSRQTVEIDPTLSAVEAALAAQR